VFVCVRGIGGGGTQHELVIAVYRTGRRGRSSRCARRGGGGGGLVGFFGFFGFPDYYCYYYRNDELGGKPRRLLLSLS